MVRNAGCWQFFSLVSYNYLLSSMCQILLGSILEQTNQFKPYIFGYL